MVTEAASTLATINTGPEKDIRVVLSCQCENCITLCGASHGKVVWKESPLGLSLTNRAQRCHRYENLSRLSQQPRKVRDQSMNPWHDDVSYTPTGIAEIKKRWEVMGEVLSTLWTDRGILLFGNGLPSTSACRHSLNTLSCAREPMEAQINYHARGPSQSSRER